MSTTPMVRPDDPVTAIARATRQQRESYAAILGMLAFVAPIVGFFGWNASKPSMADSAHNVTVAIGNLQCAQDGTSCGGHYITAQPLWLYAGFGVAGVLLIVAFLLLATRPAVPRAPRPSGPAIVGQPDDFPIRH